MTTDTPTEGRDMRTFVTTALLTGLLTGALAAPAFAGPVQELSCYVQDKIGVENVQECDASNPDS